MSRLFDYNLPTLSELLSESEANALRQAATLQHYQHGETIHGQGEIATSMSWIESGAVAFGRHSRAEGFLILAEFGPGHHFGDFVASADTHRRLTSVAIGTTAIREIGNDSLRTMVDRWPGLMKAFAIISSSRLALILEFYDDARRLKAPQRIAKFLLILQKSHPDQQTFNCTQADLSNILGISSVTVNQTLRTLEDRALIEIGYRTVRIVSSEGMRAFIADD